MDRLGCFGSVPGLCRNRRALLGVVRATIIHHSSWDMTRVAQVVDDILFLLLGDDVG